MDVRYVNEIKGLKMIVHNGAPKSIVSLGWIERYFDSMDVNRNEVEERYCHRKFSL